MWSSRAGPCLSLHPCLPRVMVVTGLGGPSWDPGVAPRWRSQQDLALPGKEGGTWGWLLSSSASSSCPVPQPGLSPSPPASRSSGGWVQA